MSDQVKVPLSLQESGTLIHLLVKASADSPQKTMSGQPAWFKELYLKLVEANDKLMGEKE